jgi:hypothetical protein
MRRARTTRTVRSLLLAGAALAAAAGTARADLAAELARLAGHRVAISPDGASYRILDVAGEGAPEVGVIERRGRALFLRRTDGSAVELAGPLAVPRIAGPGYKVWVLGRLARGALVVRRLGVLAPPSGANSGTMPSP